MFAHRTISNAAITEPSRELTDTLTDMQSAQEWMCQDIVECGEGNLPFVGSYQVGQTTAVELANDIRRVLQLHVEWYLEDGRVMPVDEAFKLLREHCTDSGIVVMLNGVVRDNTHRPLDAQEFRAFALVDEYAPLIFINRTDSRHGQIFSLAHEIVHIWLGAEEIYNDFYQYESNAPIEVLCNAVVAELLVPRTIFVRRWRWIVEEGSADDAIEELAERFPVSQVVIARRALDEGFISSAKYQNVVDACRRHWEDQRASSTSGGNYYSTKRSRLDHRFVERLVASVSEGRTSYTDAYRLTGTNRRTFSNVLKPMEVW